VIRYFVNLLIVLYAGDFRVNRRMAITGTNGVPTTLGTTQIGGAEAGVRVRVILCVRVRTSRYI
jgi:hypothetical protein